MPLKDYYNTGDDNQSTFYGVNWVAQTFTASENYDIAYVKLLIYKAGSPGTFDISIRATSVSFPYGPTGADLTAGSINGNDLATSTPASFVQINLTPYSLVSGTVYAIVARATAGDASNYVRWRRDTSTAYSAGQYGSSSNSGSTWGMNSSIDHMFETYTAATRVDIAGTDGGVSSGSADLRDIVYEPLAATDGGVSGGNGDLDVIPMVNLSATDGGVSGGSAVLTALLFLTATGGGVSGGIAVLRRAKQYRIARKIIAISNNKVYYENR